MSRERKQERALYVVDLKHPIVSYGDEITQLRFTRRARAGDMVKCGKHSSEMEQMLRIVAGTAGITYAEALTLDLEDMAAVGEGVEAVTGDGNSLPPESGEG